jgi:RNA polymerase sigma-70 factor, ECF subfamily
VCVSAMQPSLAEIEDVYRSRGRDFLSLALARTGDPEEARDAVQEGFARAIRGRSSFRGSGLLEAWIARCVMNAANDVTRRGARTASAAASGFDVAATSNGGPVSSQDRVSVDSDASRVRDAVRQLPQRQRDALFLRFYLGFDYAAIAAALGVEVGTVSATLHAARASLAEHLEEVTR